jgi:hypothetical protein
VTTPRAPRRRRGPVERKVRADIAALVTAHPMGEALTEMNRELRANLAELSRMAVGDGDDLADELSAPGELPAPVRDEEEP